MSTALGRKQFYLGAIVLGLALMLVLATPGFVFAGGGDGNDAKAKTVAANADCTTDPTFYVVLDPKETRTIPVNGFCMNRGLPFPGQQLVFADAAPAAVQAVIKEAVEKGYHQRMPELWSTQLAIWHLLDGETTDYAGQVLADEIAASATAHANDVPECVRSASVPLPEAVKAGLVSARVDVYSDISPKDYDFYGEGTLVIENQTDKVQVLSLPNGVRFADAKQSGVQDMAIFPASVAAMDDPPAPQLPETGALLPTDVVIALALLLMAASLFVFRKRAIH